MLIRLPDRFVPRVINLQKILTIAYDTKTREEAPIQTRKVMLWCPKGFPIYENYTENVYFSRLNVRIGKIYHCPEEPDGYIPFDKFLEIVQPLELNMKVGPEQLLGGDYPSLINELQEHIGLDTIVRLYSISNWMVIEKRSGYVTRLAWIDSIDKVEAVYLYLDRDIIIVAEGSIDTIMRAKVIKDLRKLMIRATRMDNDWRHALRQALTEMSGTGVTSLLERVVESRIGRPETGGGLDISLEG